MSNLAHSPKNDTRMKEFLADVASFGRDAAAGNDALPSLGLRVARAAADGVIDDKSAASIYEHYTKSQSKKAIHTENGKGANASKLRQFIKLGAVYGDAGVDLLERVYSVRNQLAEDTERKVHPAYAAALLVVRYQLQDERQGIVCTDEEIEWLVQKAEPKEKSEREVLENIQKALEKVIEGNKSTGEGKFPSPQAHYAHEQITNRITELLAAEEEEAKRREMEEKGITVPQAPRAGVQGASQPVATPHDGTSGQDRDSYSDTQDRSSYAVDDTPEADDAHVTSAVPNADELSDEELIAELENRVKAAGHEVEPVQFEQEPTEVPQVLADAAEDMGDDEAPLDEGWDDAAPAPAPAPKHAKPAAKKAAPDAEHTEQDPDTTLDADLDGIVNYV